jgi:hypothetical protein
MFNSLYVAILSPHVLRFIVTKSRSLKLIVRPCLDKHHILAINIPYLDDEQTPRMNRRCDVCCRRKSERVRVMNAVVIRRTFSCIARNLADSFSFNGQLSFRQPAHLLLLAHVRNTPNVRPTSVDRRRQRANDVTVKAGPVDCCA